MKLTLLALAIIAIIVPSALSAPTAESKVSISPETIEFTCASWEQLLPGQELFYRSGDNILPIRIPVGQRSELHSLESFHTLELLVRTKDPDDSAEHPEYKLVGLAPLMKGAKRMLFIIETGEDRHGLPFLLHGMEDSLESFPAGAFKFENFTAHPLRIELAGNTVDLPPSETAVITPVIPPTGGFMPVFIRNVDGASLLESRLLGQPTGRELVILSPSVEGTAALAIKFLSDFVSPAPVAPEDAKSTK